jgi:hypothetical protein
MLSLSVNADPVEDVWDWANDNPIATAAIVVGGGVTIGPIVAAYFAVPVALPIICSKALENSAIVSGVTLDSVSPAAAPTTSSTAVGANSSAANATGTAKYAAITGPTVTPPPTTIAAVGIMGDTAVDDLSGYTVETVGRSARAASLGNISLDATEVTRLLPPR